MDDKPIYFGGAIKALGDNGRVEGYAVRFTDGEIRDLHGQYFTNKTNFHIEDGYAVKGEKTMYQHGLDLKMGVRRIGQVTHMKIDDVGMWVEAQISLNDEYNRAVYDLAKEGRLAWSSGALPQSVEVDDNGEIKSWAIIELSLTPTPAQPFLTKIQTLKALTETLREADTLRGVQDAPDGDVEHKTKAIDNDAGETALTGETKTMLSPEEIKLLATEIVAQMNNGNADAADVAAIAPAMEEENKAETPEVPEDELRKAVVEAGVKAFNALNAKKKSVAQATVKSHIEAMRNTPGVSQTHQVGIPTGGGRIQVGENRKYAHLSASDMALGIQMRLAPFKSQGMPVRLDQVVSEDYIRTMVGKMNRHADSSPYGRNAKSATHAELGERANYHIKSVIPFKANELDASNLAAQGDEWVGEFWSTDLWERERFDRHYDRMIQRGMWVQTIERGAETAHFPTEGSDPVAYTAPQAYSVDATGRPESTININPFGTGRVSLTPSEIKIATAFTTILDEDSVINVVQTANRQLNEAAMETRDKLMVNGDTTTGTTNINYDGSAPATGLQTPYYIASNGFRKTALAAGRDASNALNLAQYRLTLALLDGELRQYYEKMLFMIDPTTEMASLAITEIATDDVRRTNATVTSGRLINIHGVDVLVNGFLPLTDTDGKVTASGNVASRGTIMLVYAPYWGVAYKRNVTLETARDIYSGSNVYVMSMRVGFVARGSNAAVLSYNVATTAS